MLDTRPPTQLTMKHAGMCQSAACICNAVQRCCGLKGRSRACHCHYPSSRPVQLRYHISVMYSPCVLKLYALYHSGISLFACNQSLVSNTVMRVPTCVTQCVWELLYSCLCGALCARQQKTLFCCASHLCMPALNLAHKAQVPTQYAAHRLRPLPSEGSCCMARARLSYLY